MQDSAQKERKRERETVVSTVRQQRANEEGYRYRWREGEIFPGFRFLLRCGRLEW